MRGHELLVPRLRLRDDRLGAVVGLAPHPQQHGDVATSFVGVPRPGPLPQHGARHLPAVDQHPVIPGGDEPRLLRLLRAASPQRGGEADGLARVGRVPRLERRLGDVLGFPAVAPQNPPNLRFVGAQDRNAGRARAHMVEGRLHLLIRPPGDRHHRPRPAVAAHHTQTLAEQALGAAQTRGGIKLGDVRLGLSPRFRNTHIRSPCTKCRRWIISNDKQIIACLENSTSDFDTLLDQINSLI